jgi:hypothetical protein
MPAYFLCANVNRRIANLIFEPVGHVGGVNFGVYQTSNETEISALRAEVSPANGLEEITETQYAAQLKKKPENSLVLTPFVSEQMPLADKPGVVVEDPASLPEAPPAEPATPDTVIKVEQVDVPEPEPVPVRAQSRRR